MHLLTTLTALALTLLPLAHAANCQNSPGVANGQCVKFYGNGECKGGALGSYKPDCTGACFRYNSFGSLSVGGDGTYGTLFSISFGLVDVPGNGRVWADRKEGTRCVAYSDDNCNNQVQDTGNVVVGAGKCSGTPGAKSMRCYYRC
jgi:hypothetical protein